jgi:hypothetical protein
VISETKIFYKKPAPIDYRKAFVQQYLTYESRAFHWIQITREESKELEEEGKNPRESRYRYTQKDRVDMVEYHVDSCHLFQDRMKKHTLFGGSLSVQSDPTSAPLLISGHDELHF